MIKIIGIFISLFIVLMVIGRILKALNDEYLRQLEKEKLKKSCIRCKHLYFYNDGTPYCLLFKTDSNNNTCIKSGFLYKDTEVPN